MYTKDTELLVGQHDEDRSVIADLRGQLAQQVSLVEEGRALGKELEQSKCELSELRLELGRVTQRANETASAREQGKHVKL